MFTIPHFFGSISVARIFPRFSVRLKPQAFLKTLEINSDSKFLKSPILLDTLRVLEWDKLCDSVSSFAGTSLGRKATKVQLLSLDLSYEESKNLLAETNAAVEMIKYGVNGLTFSGLNLQLVNSAIRKASRGGSMSGKEALAVANLLELSETLKLSLGSAVKEDENWYNRFMPLSEMINELVTDRTLIRAVQQVVDEDGSVRDNASSDLKRLRIQIQMINNKLQQLMDNILRNEFSETSSFEVRNVDGRWCICSRTDDLGNFNGLLLSSGSSGENLVEPISAFPLNDELQQARIAAMKAEETVLFKLTEKMRVGLDGIQKLLNDIIHMDVIMARAKYSLEFGGTCPDITLEDNGNQSITCENSSSRRKIPTISSLYSNQKEWLLYIRRVYHPLLLGRHREKLKKVRKDISDATSEIRRRKMQGDNRSWKETMEVNLTSLENQLAQLEGSHPVPVDFILSKQTKVLVITGPNTGGKTISLKTIGLAALMAKAGLYVVGMEPIRIPWFDFVFADIGDEQSLSQSLSTFSGHLKQISAIQEQSTSKSLVLLDEVGAGTNPLEGASIGMALLESFSELGAALTIATTHHGELKTLKYSNMTFENACVEFDEVNLKPTYNILWGVPGRSNAINIAEKLGLPRVILDGARVLYGKTSTEINEVIIDMEKFKQEFHQNTMKAQTYLMQARELHENLLMSRQRIIDNNALETNKTKEILEIAATARSLIHKKLRQFRESASQNFKNRILDANNCTNHSISGTSPADTMKSSAGVSSSHRKHNKASPIPDVKIPKVGSKVYIPSLCKDALVVRVEESKDEIIVQAINMKLRLKLSDISPSATL